MAGISERSAAERVTNADLALLLGGIDTRLTVIEGTTGRLDKAINGNGKPGLLEDYRCLQVDFNNHIKEAKDQKERADADKKTAIDKREKFSARTWAIVMAVIGAFITQTVGLVILFIRTGAIK